MAIGLCPSKVNNKMTTFDGPTGMQEVGAYTYDGLGNRVRRFSAIGSSSAVNTTYVYDAFGKLAAEYSDAAPAPADAGTFYRTTDHLGSTRLVTEADGTAKRCYDFYPFGESIPSSLGGRSNELCYGGSEADAFKQKFTAKERDDESGLDYFGARYLSPALGRWTGPDEAGPDLSNPATLNKYRYGLNNPLRYVDPNGLYEWDVHWQLTKVLGMAAGLSFSDAVVVANANQGVDTNPETEPLGLLPCCSDMQKRADYHFTTAERRGQLYSDYLESGDLKQLGVFLHAQQDSYSHAGYGPRLGQLPSVLDHGGNPYATDYTSTDTRKSNTMAQETFTYLATAAAGRPGAFSPVPWKSISKLVSKYNSAKDPSNKRKYWTKIARKVARATVRKEEDKKRQTPLGPATCSAEFSSCPGNR